MNIRAITTPKTMNAAAMTPPTAAFVDDVEASQKIHLRPKVQSSPILKNYI